MSCLALDRVAPTRRPAVGSVVGHQQWRNLLFLHWSVPAAVMREVVPADLELDLWDGRAFVGAVPFEMVGIRPAWWPRAMALDFLETNLRTYVHRRGEPGVYFFSLEASSRLAVLAARWGWGLPYHHARMNITATAGVISYTSERRGDRGAALRVQYRPGAHLGPSAAGSLEHFLLERYYLFVCQRGRVWKGRVHHGAYPAQTVDLLDVDVGLAASAGLPALVGAPEHAHYAAGVDVEIFGLRRETRPHA